MSVMLIKATREPSATGVKTTVIVQVALAARVELQVVAVIAKSPALVPVIADAVVIGAFEIVNVVVPVFVSVVACGELDEPRLIVPKASVVGENETPGPLPVLNV